MRKLMRSVARANMKRLGISQPCKNNTGEQGDLINGPEGQN